MIDLLFTRPLLALVAYVRRHPLKFAAIVLVMFLLGTIQFMLAALFASIFGRSSSTTDRLVKFAIGPARWLIPIALAFFSPILAAFAFVWLVVDSVWPRESALEKLGPKVPSPGEGAEKVQAEAGPVTESPLAPWQAEAISQGNFWTGFLSRVWLAILLLPMAALSQTAVRPTPGYYHIPFITVLHSNLVTYGGNARGSNATDLQVIRNLPTQIASGPFSFLGGGAYNRVTGAGSVIVAGSENDNAGGQSAIVGGTRSTIMGENSQNCFMGAPEGGYIGTNCTGCSITTGSNNRINDPIEADGNGWPHGKNTYSSILNGHQCDIAGLGSHNLIANGYYSAIIQGAENTIAAGNGNTISYCTNSAILGGNYNSIQNGSNNVAIGSTNILVAADSFAVGEAISNGAPRTMTIGYRQTNSTAGSILIGSGLNRTLQISDGAGHQFYGPAYMYSGLSVSGSGNSGLSIWTNARPAAAPMPGAATFWNSNGVVYLLTCPYNSTTWSATNKLGP